MRGSGHKNKRKQRRYVYVITLENKDKRDTVIRTKYAV
jgi:hypothetical protein